MSQFEVWEIDDMKLAKFVSDVQLWKFMIVFFNTKNSSRRRSEVKCFSCSRCFPYDHTITHGKTGSMCGYEASYGGSVVTHTLLLSAVGIPDLSRVETKSESEISTYRRSCFLSSKIDNMICKLELYLWLLQSFQSPTFR